MNKSSCKEMCGLMVAGGIAGGLLNGMCSAATSAVGSSVLSAANYGGYDVAKSAINGALGGSALGIVSGFFWGLASCYGMKFHGNINRKIFCVSFIIKTVVDGVVGYAIEKSLAVDSLPLSQGIAASAAGAAIVAPCLLMINGLIGCGRACYRQIVLNSLEVGLTTKLRNADCNARMCR